MKGFTLIELIIVMGIGAVILASTTVLLLGGGRRVAKSSAQEQILSDIRVAQLNAMTGENGGGGNGIYLDTSFYTLFKGLAYNVNDTSNFVVNLDHNIQLVTTFPGSAIVFLPMSGEINNYVSGLDTVSILDATDSTSRTLHFNKYGVATVQN